MKYINHFWVSIAKSIIRIIGCATAIPTKSVATIATAMLLAELLGILEELADKRKE